MPLEHVCAMELDYREEPGSGWSSGFQITRLIHPEMDDELMRAATFGVSKHPQALNSQERLGSDSQLDQLALDGIAGGSSAGVDTQLTVDGGQVRVDRTGADDEPIGHLGIGQPLGHQAQHLHFACRQSSRTIGWLVPSTLS